MSAVMNAILADKSPLHQVRIELKGKTARIFFVRSVFSRISLKMNPGDLYPPRTHPHLET